MNYLQMGKRSFLKDKRLRFQMLGEENKPAPQASYLATSLIVPWPGIFAPMVL